MKIAFISSYNVNCGIARYTRYLAQEVFKKGVEVKIFAAYKKKGEIFDRKLGKLNLEAVRCWSAEKGKIRGMGKLLKELKKYNPDIIHIQDPIFSFERDEEKIENKKVEEIFEYFPNRIISTMHYFSLSKSYYFFLKNIERYISYFIVHNQISRLFLTHFLKIPEGKVAKIPHGSLEYKKIKKEEARRVINYPIDGILLSSFGFFNEKKGIIEIIKTIPYLARKFPSLRYVHIGRPRLTVEKENIDFSYLKNCKKLIKKLKMGKYIKLVLKYLPEKDIQLHLKASDIILLFYPERYPYLDSSGIAHTVVGAGRPVIGTDVFALSEFSEDTIYKIAHNKKDLLKRIEEVLENKNLQKKLVKNSLKYAKKTSWKNIAQKHIEIYRELLDNLSYRNKIMEFRPSTQSRGRESPDYIENSRQSRNSIKSGLRINFIGRT